MKKKLFAICASFSTIVLCYLILMLGMIMYFNAPNSYHNQDKRFIIESGMTLRQVVEKLHHEKIIKSPNSFLYISQLIKGVDPKVRYGEYFFERNISYYKILHKMVKGNIFFRKVTVAEGLSTNSALKAIQNSPGLIGQLPENLKEGSLLPETYFYSFNDTKLSIVKRMQDAMRKSIDELWEKRDLSIPIQTKEQALVLASIVEKETGIESERTKVASVFVNRLQKGMKLQSDPTIIYSFTLGDKSLERPIKVSDIQNNSQFNTYHIYGLPPTPICNPGSASIKAVLNPIKSDFLFFVASGNGDHVFSTNVKDHNTNVARYRTAMQNKQAAKASAPSLTSSNTPEVKKDDTLQNPSETTDSQPEAL